MTSLEMQLLAMMILIFFLTSAMGFIDKRIVYSMVGIYITLALLWANEQMSRNDRMAFCTNHFDAGGEIVCKDNHAHPLLISTYKGWERKGPYLFRNTKGVELLEDSCEIIGQTQPTYIQMKWLILCGIAAAIWLIGWLVVIWRSINRDINKPNERCNDDDTKC